MRSNQLKAILFIAMIASSVATTTSSGLSRHEELQVYQNFKQIAQNEVGRPLLEMFLIQLENLNEKGEQKEEVDNSKKPAVQRMIEILNDIRKNLLQDQDVLSKQQQEQETSCQKRVPGLKLNLRAAMVRIEEAEVKLPPLDSKLEQKLGEINDKQIAIDFSNDEIKQLRNTDNIKQAEYEKSRAEHNRLIQILNEAKQKINLLLGKSFLQLDNSTQLVQLQKEVEHSLKQIKDDHNKLFYSIIVNLVQKPNIQADQNAVSTVIEVIDNLIESETDAISQEHQLNLKRHNRFLDRVSQQESIIEKITQDKERLEGELQLSQQRVHELRQDKSDTVESKKIIQQQIDQITQTCMAQLKGIDSRLNNFGDLLELIRQILVILEKSSLAYVKATVEEVLSGEFYNDHRGNGPSLKRSKE